MSDTSYADSPFADNITLVEMPKRFVVPCTKLYDGKTDPYDHVAQYEQSLMIVTIPQEQRDACMCMSFVSTLQEPALDWFVCIPNRTISSFAQLVNMFNVQSARNRKIEKRTSDLYRLV